MSKETLPLADCLLSAIVEVSTNGENAKTAPIKMVARTTRPVPSFTKEYGYIVHDFAGMQVNKNRFPIDYGHDAQTVIGYANNVTVQGDELHLSGALVPYAEKDMASEVIYKSQNGIPYEASIFTGNEIKVEKIAKGFSAEVNGVTVEGPVTIFREWELRGVAVVPYGRDADTSTTIALSNIKGEVTLSNSDTSTEATEVEAVEVVEVQDTQPAEATAVEAGKAEGEQVTDVQPVEATQLSEGKRFLTAFGAQGGVWFAEGKSWEEAQTEFHKSLKAENESLRNELEKMKSEFSAIRGEVKPVSFSQTQTDEQKEMAQKLTQFKGKLPDGLAKFAASLNVNK